MDQPLPESVKAAVQADAAAVIPGMTEGTADQLLPAIDAAKEYRMHAFLLTGKQVIMVIPLLMGANPDAAPTQIWGVFGAGADGGGGPRTLEKAMTVAQNLIDRQADPTNWEIIVPQ